MPHSDFILLIYIGSHDLLQGFHVYYQYQHIFAVESHIYFSLPLKGVVVEKVDLAFYSGSFIKRPDF